jgi:hypothetical protein
MGRENNLHYPHSGKVVDVKKIPSNFYPPEALEKFRRAIDRWLSATSKRDCALGDWAQEIAGDDDVMSALGELVCWYKVPPKDLLEFLAELWTVHVPARELRAHIRNLGKSWKQIEALSLRARKESEPYLGEQRQKAVDIENAARFLSRYFTAARAKRPLETEIAECKEDIVSFLRRRRVREVNQYGWILLKGVFREQWSAGDGADQIEAFRQIPRPFIGETRTRAAAERVIQKAKLDVLRMEQELKKS